MRTSTRLLSNATTTYLRLGTTFVLGIFTTWYMVGAIGVVGFGLLSLASASTGVTRALEQALRMGLVRELAAAIASEDPRAIRRSLTSAFRLCLQTLVPLSAIIATVALIAGLGIFNTPSGYPGLGGALVALILGEGIYAAVRLLGAPFLQSLFAAQRVGLDNLLMIVGRITYALSAVLVFGWILEGRDLATQIIGYAVSRATLQLADVALGIALAKRLIPDLRLDSSFDRSEYLSIRSTVWHSSQIELLINLSPQFLAIVINLVFGLAYNGLWQLVVQLSGYVRMLTEGLLRGIAPLTAHLENLGRRQVLIDLMSRTIRYQLALALPASIVLGMFIEPLLHLWVGSRLSDDPQLVAAGLSPSEAIRLAAGLTVVMLVARSVRSFSFGVERILYGLGRVRSYAWFSKWAVPLSVALGGGLMLWLGHPIGAPLGILTAYSVYSLGVVPLAAKRETGLQIIPTVRRAVPGPSLASLILFAALIPVRLTVDRLSLVGLAVLIASSGLVYCGLALAFVAEPDERRRLAQLIGSLWKRLPLGSPRPK